MLKDPHVAFEMRRMQESRQGLTGEEQSEQAKVGSSRADAPRGTSVHLTVGDPAAARLPDRRSRQRIAVRVVAAGLLIVVASVAAMEGNALRHEASRLRADARADLRQRDASVEYAQGFKDRSSSLTASSEHLQPQLRAVNTSQNALAGAQQKLVTDSDAAIAQYNTGASSAARATFGSTVTADADQYDAALARFRSDVQAALAALAEMDSEK